MFYRAATNHKLDGNWKINGNVIHFLSFAGMLQVIFGIFSPSSHFCQVRQKRKLFLTVTGWSHELDGPLYPRSCDLTTLSCDQLGLVDNWSQVIPHSIPSTLFEILPVYDLINFRYLQWVLSKNTFTRIDSICLIACIPVSSMGCWKPDFDGVVHPVQECCRTYYNRTRKHTYMHWMWENCRKNIIHYTYYTDAHHTDAIDHFRIVSIRPGWAHSQRRVGVNITIPFHWPSCEWTLTLPIFLVCVRYQQ